MTPLVIVAFNRPDRLRKVLEAVKNQTRKPDRIIAFIDGARGDYDRGLVGVTKRELTAVADEVNERPHNYGCALNIMRSIADITARYDRFVLLEDDTLPARTWYEAMCDLLDRYEHEPRVGAVGSFPSILNGSLPDYPHDVIYSPRFSCWGWGSWSAKWQLIWSEWEQYRTKGPPWDPSKLPLHGGADIPGMIQNHPTGQLWDGMVAGSFLHHGLLQAIPKYYLVHNIGADLHLNQQKLHFMISNNPIQERAPSNHPPAVEFNEKVAAAVCDYVRAMST